MRLVLLSLLLVVGCSKSEPIPPPLTTPVSGKVISSSGSAITAGRIIFKPKEAGKQEAVAEINSDGTFKLSSFAKDDGAVPGEYKVVFEKVSYKTGSAVAVKADIPQKYLKESDLVVVVVEGQTDYLIRLK